MQTVRPVARHRDGERAVEEMTVGQRELSRLALVRKASVAEERFLDDQLLRLRQLESRTRGLFAEGLIAYHLGPSAHGSSYAASPWDLCWEDRTIAVRVTGQYNSETVLPADGQDPVATRPHWKFSRRRAFTDDGTLSDESRGVWADVLVLGLHEGEVIEDGWTFIVIGGRVIDDEGINALGLPQALGIAERGRAVRADELSEVVGSMTSKARRRGSVFPVRCDDAFAHAASRA